MFNGVRFPLTSSFPKRTCDDFLLLFCFVLCLTAARCSDDWITVKRVTANPVFVTVGQTLKLRLDIENLQVDKWDTNAFWVYAKNVSSREYDLQWIRKVGSNSEMYNSYNKTRVSRERYVDLVVSSITLADSGIYRCKFRKPPKNWNTWIAYKVIVEEREGNLRQGIPQILYITKGGALRLKPNLPGDMATAKNYEIFWDFSSSLLSKQEETIRIIEFMEDSVKTMDERASLGENNTSLILTNTTLNDSGVYHVRFVKKLSITAIHMHFHVIVEDKPVAKMDCPSIVRLTKGDNFFCLCKDISTSEVTARASWLQDGENVKNTRLFHEEELYLRNISNKDAGVYTCRVRSETMVNEVSLKILVLPVVQEKRATISSIEQQPDWYYMTGSLGIGLILGIGLVVIIISIRRKSRKSPNMYEDTNTSSGVELDTTAEYVESRESSQYETDVITPYEIADLTCPIYMNINEVKLKPEDENEPGCSHQNTFMSGYTDLDYRARVDSHPYQGLQQYHVHTQTECRYS